MLEGFYNIRVQSDVRRVNKGASFSREYIGTTEIELNFKSSLFLD